MKGLFCLFDPANVIVPYMGRDTIITYHNIKIANKLFSDLPNILYKKFHKNWLSDGGVQ